MNLSIYIYKRVFIIALVVVIMFIMAANKSERHKRYLLNLELRQALEIFTLPKRFSDVSQLTSSSVKPLQKTVDVEKQVSRHKWTPSSKRYQSWNVKNVSKIPTQIESDVTRKKNRNIALYSSHLSPQKKDEIRRFREYDATKRKDMLKSKISKMQDKWARKHFELITDPVYTF
ncbi:uncharacterized protein LOC143915594 [Arctopsyche grandis]|uniref:uncharacterized protein LOC143915594 n=1 Tax=Arctopsyche grandis TaxID=121162 RepID=UPI00406D7501